MKPGWTNQKADMLPISDLQYCEGQFQSAKTCQVKSATMSAFINLNDHINEQL